MKVLTSSLHLEYVDPDQMFQEQNAKKSRVYIGSLQKKIMDIQADTLRMKKWENGSLIIIYYVIVKMKKNNSTCALF